MSMEEGLAYHIRKEPATKLLQHVSQNESTDISNTLIIILQCRRYECREINE